ncbi:hypothetical protein [Paenibacillus sp. FJAT-27812]|uniref:hypothetical protein n=1 Tax=Paenibacillus sp. FJAT-27812 TaxID=1684143 RepID=UPI0006A7C314|nr:hypothetical protein [Paenibacillus sp. FJAT-27812]
MRPDHYKLMYEFVKWAGEQSHIAGIALVGPCADDENEEDSNLSFLLISDKKTKTLEAILHQFPFEPIEQATKEEWGLLTSFRIEYASGMEVEYGVAGEEWLRLPLDQEMGDTVMKGFKVIWDREELFVQIIRYIETHQFE